MFQVRKDLSITLQVEWILGSLILFLLPWFFVACFSLDCDGYGLIGVLGFGWSVAGGCRCLYREQLCDLVYWL